MDFRELQQEHFEASVSVYCTRRYGRFAFKEGNRDLNERKINRMQEACQEKGLNLLKYNPILVSERADGKLEIEDGQHRFYLSKKMGANVYYMVLRESLNISSVAALNRNQEKWNPQDFINAFITKGIEDYGYLDKFCKKFKLPISISAALLTYGTSSGGSLTAKIESGEFRAIKRQEALKIIRTLNWFRSYPAYKERAFIRMVCKLIESEKEFSWERLIHVFNQRVETVQRVTDYKSYLQQIETIYNYKLSKRVTLY